MRVSTRVALSILSGCALLVSLLPQAPLVHAATFTVDRVDDPGVAGQVDPAAALCTVAANDCSLRGAVRLANTTPGADTITVPAGTYTLTIPGRGEDAALKGDLDITESVTITGAGAATTIIQGGTSLATSVDRVFEVRNAGVVATISGLAIRNGDAADAGDLGGGGIQVIAGATLNLTNASVSSNQARLANNDGGGIRGAVGTTVTLENVIVSGNTAADVGGGILSNSTATLTNVTITGNSTTASVGRGGGGLFVATGTITVTNATVADNTAAGVGTFADQGGGIFNNGTLTLTNVTVSGNRNVDGDGGGIGNFGGTLTLQNVTVANNTADGAGNGGGVARSGGAFSSGGTLNVGNSIIALNVDIGGQAPDCSGTLTSQGDNLIQSVTGCIITGTTTGNLTGQDPLLGPLADNGGSTRTRALLAGSPAIDAVTKACPPPATDQRG